MKTVKVRIAVAVEPTGYWVASGEKGSSGSMDVVVDCVKSGEARYWVTAELQVPEAKEVAGIVKSAQPPRA